MGHQSIGIGLVGCGVVGSGVVKLLVEQAALYHARLGKSLELRAVLCRREDIGERTAQVPTGKLVHDVDAFFKQIVDCDIIIELAGGKTFALDIVRHALTMGKHVVTANKALLASHGAELFALARKHKVAIAYEASCAGGIPLITAMQFNLASNQINALYGILNGTCNYILTQMTEQGKDYATALQEAQQQGFAEADPTLDVTGGDTSHKLAILASMAFGVTVIDRDIPCSGIDTLKLDDIHFADELGYRIKLLAIGERTDAGLSLSVAPCFVHANQQLANVGGPFNAVSIFGHAVGHTLFYGRGAGQMPTASAVVGDLLNLACGSYERAFHQLAIWPDQGKPLNKLSDDQQMTRYYLRLNALDVPGVVAQFAGALGEEGISLAAVMQHEVNAGGFVPVVVVTHQTSVGAMRRAADRIAALDCISGRPVCIRIVDMPQG
ncbi:MAG: homoserine dehydrogenase [Phycisphaerales bacterium]